MRWTRFAVRPWRKSPHGMLLTGSRFYDGGDRRASGRRSEAIQRTRSARGLRLFRRKRKSAGPDPAAPSLAITPCSLWIAAHRREIAGLLRSMRALARATERD
jgi:hypothetical protein